LADLKLLELPDHPRAQHQGEKQRRDTRESRAKGNVVKKIEDVEVVVEFEIEVVEHKELGARSQELGARSQQLEVRIGRSDAATRMGFNLPDSKS